MLITQAEFRLLLKLKFPVDQKRSASASELRLNLESKVHEFLTSYSFHLGCSTSELHRSMEKQVRGNRNGASIIDLNKTFFQIGTAMNFIADIVKKEGHIIMVITDPDVARVARFTFRDVLKKGRLSLITTRQRGGCISNFPEFYKRRTEARAAQYGDQTRSEQRHYHVRRKSYRPRLSHARRPDAVLLFNVNIQENVVKEAKRCGVPIVAIANTDCKYGDDIDYVIPANEKALMGMS